MAYITIADWPGGSLPVFEEEHASEVTRRGGDPDGLLARYVGEENKGLRIVAVWTSQTDAEEFFASLPEATARRLAPASGGVPSVTALTALNSYVAR
jgi:hypothetical protein